MSTVFCHDSPYPHTFPSRDIMFRCLNPACPRRGPDEVYGRARGVPAIQMGPWFTATGMGHIWGYVHVPASLACPYCGIVSHTQICPICHGLLNDANLPHPIISLVGGSSVGKTCYLTSALHTLPQALSQFGLPGYVIGDGAANRWPILKRLFSAQHVLPQRTDKTQTKPIIFRVSDEGGPYDLAFYDAGGEAMRSVSDLENNVRQLHPSAGVIFMIDPLQLEPVRQELTKRGFTAFPPKQDELEASTILPYFFQVFEGHGLATGTLPDKPFAFTLTKLDYIMPLVSSLLPPDSPLLRGTSLIKPIGQGSAEINEAVLKKVNDHVLTLIEKWDPLLHTYIINNFESYRCFAVSALGYNPVNDTLRDVSPKRVEDPILWLLRELDLL